MWSFLILGNHHINALMRPPPILFFILAERQKQIPKKANLEV